MSDRTLYDATRERDACGIGFVADARGRASREVLDVTLEALRRVRHRGAVAADRLTGDGPSSSPARMWCRCRFAR